MSDPYIEYQVGVTPEDTFVVPFQFWEKDDLYVEVGGVQELNFNITGAADPTGGSIILVTPVTNTLVSIRRFTVVLRITDFPIAGPFRIEALNAEFDHIYAILQDLEFFQENITIPWDNITGKPSTFPPDPHTHPWDEVTGKPTVYPPAAHTHVEAEITDLDKYTKAEVDASQAAQDDEIANRMEWKGDWVQQTYDRNDVVMDWPYTMVANKTTDDRAAPQDQGEPTYIYDGAAPTSPITAKTLLVGNTYTMGVTGKIPACRVYTVAGNFYSVYLKDLSTGQVVTLATFTADVTNWVRIAGPGNIITAGTVFEVALYVQEPDPTPVTFTLSYSYSTPNNAGTPVAGQISHADKATSSLRVHKTDQNGDQSAQLATMTPGDTIEGVGVRWSISAIVDNGTYIDFTVAPQSQGSPDGVSDFVFETVTATPITVVADADYYQGVAAVAPFYSIDGGNRVSSNDAYNVDIEIQQVEISEDWDLVALSGGGGGGDSGGGGSASITIGDDFPQGVADGHMHYKTTGAVGLYVWYNDGSSAQWVQTNGAGQTGSGIYLPLTGGTLVGPVAMDAADGTNDFSVGGVSSSNGMTFETTMVASGVSMKSLNGVNADRMWRVDVDSEGRFRIVQRDPADDSLVQTFFRHTPGTTETWSGNHWLKNDASLGTNANVHVDAVGATGNSHVYLRQAGSARGLLYYSNDTDSLVLRKYFKSDGTTNAGQIEMRDDGISFPKLRSNLNVNNKEIININNLYFDSGGTGDYIKWITANGLNGYENGGHSFRIGPVGLRVVSLQTGGSANVHATSANDFFKVSSSASVKTDVRPFSGAKCAGWVDHRQSKPGVLEVRHCQAGQGRNPGTERNSTRPAW